MFLPQQFEETRLDVLHALMRAHPLGTWVTTAAGRTLPSVVCFSGPQGYVTPSWYPTKQLHGKAVPTWNYAVVHAHGQATFIDDRDWLLPHVTAISQSQEAAREHPWQVSDAPAAYIEQNLRGIVGVEIRIERIEGKWKVSQNQPEANRRGVVEGLMQQGDAGSIAMAALVKQHLPDDSG